MEQYKVAKWGNSLAIRIPSRIVRELGLKEGDRVTPEMLGLPWSIHRLSRSEALARMANRQWRLPKDWKIDRNDPDTRG